MEEGKKLPPAPAGGRNTVLVIDDEEVVRKTVVAILSIQGYAVLTTVLRNTVLVIDDEEVVRKTVVAILSIQGYAVLTAGDGVEGLELFERHRDAIALILLDLSMPKMSGVEVIAHLQQLATEVKVLILSGYEAKTMGVSGVPSVLKPIRAKELVRQVEKALKG